MKLPASIPALLLLAGCTVGVEVAEFRPAQTPAGAQMQLTLDDNVIDGDSIEGELLAVRPDGVLLNVRGYGDQPDEVRRVVFIPYRIMDTARLDQMGRARVESQGEHTEAVLNRLRLVSRFPQGISDELLDDLMLVYGQAALEVPGKDE